MGFASLYPAYALRLSGRRIRREIADIKHGPQQRGFRQDGLRLGNDFRGRVLAAGKMLVEQRLDLGHAFTDCQRGFGRGIGRQLGDIRSDLPSLIAREQLCGRAPNGVILVVDVGQSLAALIPHDDAAVEFLDGP